MNRTSSRSVNEQRVSRETLGLLAVWLQALPVVESEA